MSDKECCKDKCSCEFESITSQTLARWNEQAAQASIISTQNFIASQNAAQQQFLMAMFPKQPPT